MFGKLLKYDFRSIGRVWWILAVSVLGVSVLGSVTFRLLTEYLKEYGAEKGAYGIFTVAILSAIISAIAVGASVLVTLILVYLRFYKNLFTDEGYLTFTLPVSRRDLLLSKTVNAMIWMVLHALLLVLCALLFLLIAPPPEEVGDFWNLTAFESLGRGFADVWTQWGAWTFLYGIEALLLAVCSLFYSISLVHFCITVGSVIAKKMKLLAAIGIYYAVNMVTSFFSQMLPYAFSFLMEGFADIFGVTTGAQYFGAIALALLIACMMVASLAGVFYFTTRGMLERKLNLP